MTQVPRNQHLVDVVLEMADADDSLGTDEELLILAALEGTDALREAIASDVSVSRPENPDSTAAEVASEPVGAFLDSISVAGFRGIGKRSVLQLHPAAGLTVVSGRNGSGKSSFSEALEFAISGNSYRWKNKSSTMWGSSWRNLHHGSPCEVRISLAEEGQGVTTLGVDWPDGAQLNDAKFWVQRPGQKRTSGLDPLGWQASVELYRPILSYDELGGLFDEGPSVLYDALAKVLGLEQISDAEKRLVDQHTLQKKPRAEANTLGKALKAALAESEDERAVAALKEVKKRAPDLDALIQLVTGARVGSGDGLLTQLRAIVSLSIPTHEAVTAASSTFRQKLARLAEVADDVLEITQKRNELLDLALSFQYQHGEVACPVCGEGELNEHWRIRVETELAQQNEQLAKHRRAANELRSARGALIELINQAGTAPEVTDVTLPSLDAYRSARKVWVEVPESDAGLAEHVDRSYSKLATTLIDLQTESERELAAREDRWAPLAADLIAWVTHEREARKADPIIKALDSARSWVKNNAATLRNQRLQPIAEQAARIWGELRQESNVDLGSVKLEGTGTRRRVVLEAEVDGAPAGALGVMSQGELHALALALFLPRASSPDSPLRFIILDDPIQAMDPSKIEGFLRVIEDLARTRQVIVFSHDDRLATTIRQLGVTAQLLEVTRGAQSAVSVTSAMNPAQRYVEDALALANDENVPSEIKNRIFPGLSRLAIEAAARQIFYAKRLRAGESREDTEAAWSRAKTASASLALALTGDPAGDISFWKDRAPYRKIAVGIAAGGVHRGLRGDPKDAAHDLRRTVDDVLQLK